MKAHTVPFIAILTLVAAAGFAIPCLAVVPAAPAAQAGGSPPGPSVRSISVESARKLDGTPARALIRLGLLGTDLDTVTEVQVPGIEPPPPAKIVSQNAQFLAVEVTMPLDTRTELLRLVRTGGSPELVTWASLIVSAVPAATNGVPEVEVTVTSFPSDAYPNLHSLLLTADKEVFVANPNQMAIEIVPAGATNMRIRPGNSTKRLIVDFLAPDKFEVKDVVASVYDSSDLDRRQLKAIGKTVKEFSKKQDANQPVITGARLVSLRRSAGECVTRDVQADGHDALQCGYGRIRIEGKGFGGDSALVRVGVLPRNPDIRVNPASITVDATRFDDKVIEAEFEFDVYKGYSVPMRLEGVSVSVTKPIRTTVRKGDLDVTVGQLETYIAATDVGPKRDGRLEYGYTVLDVNTAHQIFGRGVATNFYVIALAVVNRSEKKVAIPLSAIEAEVEWAAGDSTDPNFELLEGPSTLRPVPLATVTAFFTADNRSKGRRAKFFNILEGVRTLGQTMIPLFGPGYETAHTIFTSGLIPGAKIAIGDLSDQQLQSLAGLSWENVEEVPGNGGSKVKFVYIQRGLQEFGSVPRSNRSNGKDVKKEIKNLYGVELTGFEILETATYGGTQNKSLNPLLPDK
jgi:hypothetical protein